MRLGIPVTEKLVSQYYRKTDEIFVFDIDVENKRVINEWLISNRGSAMLPAALKSLGVTTIALGQIDPETETEFIANGISLYKEVDHVSPKALVNKYLSKNMSLGKLVS